MKKIILSLICIISTIQLSAQNFELKEVFATGLTSKFDIDTIEFVSENELKLFTYPKNDEAYTVKMGYKLSHIDGISCIVLENIIGKDFLSFYLGYSDESTIKTGNIIPFIACEYDFRSIFETDKIIHGNNIYANIMNAYPNKLLDDFSVGHVYANYRSSSHLTEGTVVYSVENLSFDNLITPWVEGVPGSGIGEYIEIYDNAYLPGDNYLMIMNGYFSTDKPYLYKQNNRVKTIKVTGLHSKKEKILEVLDTPHPQTVDISFLEMIDKAVDWDTEPIQVLEDFRITIMDIYKGTKYDDTCINCLMPWDCEVIPYEDCIGE